MKDEKEEPFKIVVPAELLADAINKNLLPAIKRKIAAEELKKKEGRHSE